MVSRDSGAGTNVGKSGAEKAKHHKNTEPKDAMIPRHKFQQCHYEAAVEQSEPGSKSGLTTEKLRRAAELKKEIEGLRNELEQLLGGQRKP